MTFKNFFKFQKKQPEPTADQSHQPLLNTPEQSQVLDPRQQQINNMPNPFQNPQFNNSLPDIPIQDNGAAMLNALLSDDNVPAEIRKEFWYVFHRDNTLTFLDEQRKASKILSFDILKIDSLNATPYYEYTFEREMKWTAARQMFETKLDRSLGNKKGQNERLTIPMTVTENITRMEDATTGNQKQGFLKRILSRN
jgi:hypothetical protein